MEYKISRAKHKNADFKDTDIEKNFLGGLLNNRKAFSKVVNSLNSNVFTNTRLKKIYDKMVETYLSSSTFSNDISILDIISIEKSKKKLYKSLFKKIKKIGKNKHSTSFLLNCKEKLELMYSARVIEIGIRDTVQTLMKARNGDFKSIENAGEIVKGLSHIVDSKSITSVHVNPISNFDRWLGDYNKYQKHPDKLKGIPTGINPIDRRITGLRDAEFGLMIGDTGIGKSIFLLDVAVNCYYQYGDVVYITIEMPAEQLENRFWCNISGISYHHFRNLTLTKAHKKQLRKLANKKAKHPFNFEIIDMKEGCMVSDIANRLEPYLKGGKIKLVCLDYMNIVAGPDGKVSLAWENQVEIAMDIKQQICRRFGVPLWSACQVTGDNLAFSRHIKDNVDVGVKFDEDEDTESTGIMQITYPKTRDFKGTRHRLQTDRDGMRMFATEEQIEERKIADREFFENQRQRRQ